MKKILKKWVPIMAIVVLYLIGVYVLCFFGDKVADECTNQGKEIQYRHFGRGSPTVVCK